MTAMPSALWPVVSAAARRSPAPWLLSPPYSCATVPPPAAVVGAFDADGSPRYTYPEIAGYYLHWLAELAHCRVSDGLDAHAGRSAAWAQRTLAGVTHRRRRATTSSPRRPIGATTPASSSIWRCC